MGAVWAAYHETLKAEVAVKLVHGDKSQHAAARARFAREAAIAAKLKSPHVTPTYDHGALADGTPYIVMELLEGESLASRLKRGPLSLDETALLIAQVAQVLGKAHRLDIMHRDVKPGNLFLIDSDYELFVKMLDFGTAKSQAPSPSMDLTCPGHLVGSPRYMSPEQLGAGREVDHRADLWALAVVAYRCLTAVPPFSGSTFADIVMAILEHSYQPITVTRPMLPKALDGWFAKAFHVNLAERFQDAKMLASSFMEIAQGNTGDSKHAMARQVGARRSITDMAHASHDSPPQSEQPTAPMPPHTPPQVDDSEEQPTQQLPISLREPSLETATFSPAATTVARTSAKNRAGTLMAMLAVLMLGAIGGYALSLPADANRAAPGSTQDVPGDRGSPVREVEGANTTRLHQPRPSPASASPMSLTAAAPAQMAPAWPMSPTATAPAQKAPAWPTSPTAAAPAQKAPAWPLSPTATAPAQAAPRRTSSVANGPTPKPAPSASTTASAASSSTAASDPPAPKSRSKDWGF